ncbi:hypothetical protein LV779_25525 [Streptomyces thinghirensis]|nr:hypothetical protein [Streptomyces thinghirensis]
MFAIPRLPDDDIRHRADLGGGALWDTGVYPVRAALHFLGDGLRVVGATLSSGPGRTVDTAGTALLAGPEGVGAQLTFGLDHAYRSTYEIWGSEGGSASTAPSPRPPTSYRASAWSAVPASQEIPLPADRPGGPHGHRVRRGPYAPEPRRIP